MKCIFRLEIDLLQSTERKHFMLRIWEVKLKNLHLTMIQPSLSPCKHHHRQGLQATIFA